MFGFLFKKDKFEVDEGQKLKEVDFSDFQLATYLMENEPLKHKNGPVCSDFINKDGKLVAKVYYNKGKRSVFIPE